LKDIIIDNNYIHKVIDRHPDCSELWKAMFGITNKKLRMVIGGKLKEELFKQTSKLKIYAIWEQAGRLRSGNCLDINSEEIRVSANLNINSDDPHVLALARVESVNILCSNDEALISDFKNPAIISPRGKVYKTDSSKGVL